MGKLRFITGNLIRTFNVSGVDISYAFRGYVLVKKKREWFWFSPRGFTAHGPYGAKYKAVLDIALHWDGK